MVSERMSKVNRSFTVNELDFRACSDEYADGREGNCGPEITGFDLGKTIGLLSTIFSTGNGGG